MNWKLKSTIQNAISLLPSDFSYASYFWVQKKFGGFKNLNPTRWIKGGIETWEKIEKYDIDPRDKIFFEVGTGRMALMPLCFWLMGAKRTITVDLNPYLKAELILQSLTFIRRHQTEIVELFGGRLIAERLEKVLTYAEKGNFDLNSYLSLCNITYIAPGDASAIDISENSIDIHTSYQVFEHIPSNILEKILIEGSRISKPDAIFAHKIDYTDHFSHSDTNISAINFLRYSEKVWSRLAGNRYMYMNRLRHDDYVAIFRKIFSTVEADTTTDINLERVLDQSDFVLDPRFQNKDRAILCTTESWVVAKK